MTRLTLQELLDFGVSQEQAEKIISRQSQGGRKVKFVFPQLLTPSEASELQARTGVKLIPLKEFPVKTRGPRKAKKAK